MQSRLAETTRRLYWVLSSPSRCTLKRGFCAATRSRTADPAIHSGEREAGPDVHKDPARVSNNCNILILKEQANHKYFPSKIVSTNIFALQGTSSTGDNSDTKTKHDGSDHVPSKGEEIFVSPKSPCDSSPKLKSTGVNQRLDPNIQQKREQGTKTTALEEASCVGFDGSPWPEDKNREEQSEDNREYYKHHKASPLSELEFVDTRKPGSRVLHGTVDSGRRGDVIGWLPEQIESAEETLMRATEIWRQNAMRGDPDAPHSRVLRALRGEDF